MNKKFEKFCNEEIKNFITEFKPFFFSKKTINFINIFMNAYLN